MGCRNKFAYFFAVLFVFVSGYAFAQSTSSEVDFGAPLESADALADSLQLPEAETAYERVIAANPNDPTGYVRYASLKRIMGEYPAALRLLQLAEQKMAEGNELRPGPSYLQLHYGITFYQGRINCDRAVAIFREGTGLNPANSTNHSHLAFSELCLGNGEEALRHLQVSERLFGDDIDDYRASLLMMGYAQLGRQQEVARLFDRLRGMENVTQASWTAAYIALGDYPQALQHLQSAIESPQTFGGADNVLSFVASNLFDDPVLSGPEFQAQFARMRGQR